MARYVALLRAVNVGGTGSLTMADLRAVCQAAAFHQVQTYIASGNAVFASDASEAEVKLRLETRLEAHTGKAIGVMVRTAAEMAAVVSANPFAEAPDNRVVAIFLDCRRTTEALLDGVKGQGADEEIRLGRREIYVRYGAGMGRSKLRIPAGKAGTARNMTTVARMAALSAALIDT